MSEAWICQGLIPAFLYNKPKIFVQHCLKRLIPMEDIERKGDAFIVNSGSGSGILHTVSTMPTCTCKDWDKFHWPCKHLLAVINSPSYPSFTWEGQPETYSNNPVFLIDTTITSPIKETVLGSRINNPQGNEEEIVSHSELPEARTPNDDRKARNGCLEMLNNIRSGIYSCSNVEILNGVKEKLETIDKGLTVFVADGMPLPIRQKKKKKKSGTRDNRKVLTDLECQLDSNVDGSITLNSWSRMESGL